MGAVFLAYDPQEEKQVVIKLLPADLSSSEMESRFKREIHSISTLTHPNCVKILDFAVTKEQCYYVMPFIPAMDLSHYMAILRGPDPAPPSSSFERLRTIVLDVAAALEHCHDHGIVHRDLKPDNILVETATHRGILADFGLARAANLTNITKSREMLGTLHYMSPELVEGTVVAGPPSDIYQMGLVVYEIFTGQLPLHAEQPLEMAMRRLKEEIPSPRTANPDLSEELATFVLDCLPREPDARITMDVFLDRLSDIPLVHPDVGERPRPASRHQPVRLPVRQPSTPSGDQTRGGGQMPERIPSEPGGPSRTPTDRPVPDPPGRNSSNRGVPTSPTSGEAVAPSKADSGVTTQRLPTPRTRMNRSSSPPRSGVALRNSQAPLSAEEQALGRSTGGRRLTGSDAGRKSRELAQDMVQQAIRRQRMRQLAPVVLGTVVLLIGGGIYRFTGSPRSVTVHASYQSVEITGRGPHFHIEVVDGGRTPVVAEAQEAPTGGWRARAIGLAMGRDYTARWVTDDGQRGPGMEVRTKELKVSQVRCAMTTTAVDVSFQTATPVQTHARFRSEAQDQDFSGGASTSHHMPLPFTQASDTKVTVDFKDADGDTGSLTIGEVASPLERGRAFLRVMEQVNVAQMIRKILKLVRKDKDPEMAKGLASAFRSGLFRDVCAGLDEFHACGPAFFKDDTVSLSERAKLHNQLNKLMILNGTMVDELIPLSFDVGGTLGEAFQRSKEDLLPHMVAEEYVLKSTEQVFRWSTNKELNKIGQALIHDADQLSPTLRKQINNKNVNDFVKSLGDHSQDELMVHLKLGDLSKKHRAQMRLEVAEMGPLIYFTVTVNDRITLFVPCPDYAPMPRAKDLTKLVYQCFPAGYLREGTNDFLIRIGFPEGTFSPGQTDAHVKRLAIKVD
jgi:serine/threonine protein kinase